MLHKHIKNLQQITQCKKIFENMKDISEMQNTTCALNIFSGLVHNPL